MADDATYSAVLSPTLNEHRSSVFEYGATWNQWVSLRCKKCRTLSHHCYSKNMPLDSKTSVECSHNNSNTITPVFFFTLCMHISSAQNIKLGYDHFCPCPFCFIILFTIYNLGTGVSKYPVQQFRQLDFDSVVI
jgi:hypothetical protein